MPFPELSRFVVEHQLGAGGMGIVYAARDRETGRRVAVKTFHHVSGDAVYRIKNEFRALADLRHPNLVRIEELCSEEGAWFFTMELVDGMSFGEWVRGNALGSLTEVPAERTADDDTRSADDLSNAATLLDVRAPRAGGYSPAASPPPWDEARLREATRQLIVGLAFLHEQRRIHCDVKPSNVVVTPEGRVVLLDFGIARLWQDDGELSATNGRVEGTVAYMAPEQARGERPSPATDLYAVGVMLYEVLCGRFPFAGSTVQILAEKQRTEPPRRFAELTQADLADLTMALLRRDPSERPSAAAALDILSRDDRGARGVPDSVQAPVQLSGESSERFFGRQAELARLTGMLEAVPSGLHTVLLRGHAGVGKSALARHFAARAKLERGALVLTSRCHEQEAVPLKAFDGLVDALSHQLLAMSEIDAALLLPPDVGALVQAFPVLARVPVVHRAARGAIGAQQSPEQRERAAVALGQILRGLARERPLVLFIDDLQWADEASWSFFAAMSASGMLPVLLLATARPTGSEDHDPVRRLAAASTSTEVVELDGLPLEDAIALLRQTVGASLDDTRAIELAAEANGHPLFLKELGRLVTSGHVGERPLTLLSALDARIDAISPRERDLLEAVSLSGSPVEVPVLARALAIPNVDALFAAQALRGSQLVRLEARGDARFVEPYHDRVREVVEARVARDPERRTDRHYQIGRALLDVTPISLRGSVIFSIVENLHHAASRCVTEASRVELATLHAEAAQRAKRATAFEQALKYVERGTALLDESGTHEELSFELAATRYEVEYLDGEYEKARETFRELVRRARTPAEIGRVYTNAVFLESNSDRDAEACAMLKEGLDRLGFSQPKKPGMLRMMFELLRTRWALRRWATTEIAELPLASDARYIAASQVVVASLAATFRSDKGLGTVIVLAWMRLLLRYGITPAAATALSAYAVTILGVLRDFAGAEKYVEAAQRSLARFDEDERSAVVNMMASVWVLPWVRPFRESVALGEQTWRDGVRNGEYLWANTCRSGVSAIESWLGSSVAELARAAEAFGADAARVHWRDHQLASENELRWAALLRTGSAEMADGAALEPAMAFEGPDDPTLRALPFWRSLRRMTAEYHFGSRVRAHAASHRIAHFETMAFSWFITVPIHFYRALSARAAMREATFARRIRLRRDIAKAKSFLRNAASSCPENFRARHLVVEADAARLLEGPTAVDQRFERAIAAATENEDLQPLALAHELWAEVLFDRRDDRATEQLERACATWERYGAAGLAARVRRRVAPR